MVEERDEPEKTDELAVKADLLHENAIDLCYVWKRYDDAIENLREAIVIRESVLGKYDNDTGLSYFRLFSILFDYKKDYTGALVLSRRELRITQSVLGIPLPGSTAGSNASASRTGGILASRISWMSNALQQINGDSKQKAKEYCSKLLRSIAMERKGDVLFSKGNFKEAIEKYNVAHELESTSFARNELDMADIKLKIGDSWSKMDDWHKAMKELDAGEARYKERFGENNAAVARIYLKKGETSLRKKRYADALHNYAKSYSGFEVTFGKTHPVCEDALDKIRQATMLEMQLLRSMEAEWSNPKSCIISSTGRMGGKKVDFFTQCE